MYLFHAQSTLSRRSSVQQPVVGVWSCENKVTKRVEVKSKILQSSTKKALKTSLVGMDVFTLLETEADMNRAHDKMTIMQTNRFYGKLSASRQGLTFGHG